MIRTHDYGPGQRGRGHDVTITKVRDGGQVIKATGWGRGICPGDYLLLPKGSGRTRYQVTEIEYLMDPDDMWFATLTFTPRTHEEKETR